MTVLFKSVRKTPDKIIVVLSIKQKENKDVGTAEVKSDQDKIHHLFHKLSLEGRRHNKLRAADVLQITEHSLQSHESCVEEELVQTFLQKILMMDYRARYISVKETNEQDQQRDADSSEDEGDFFEYVLHNTSLSSTVTSQSERIHPMDVQMAVFHCADGFLKQLMVTKLSQCQYALPLLVPDHFTQQIEFPLWTFRQINKSWKMRNNDNEIISQTQPIYNTQTPMVFFFRFGSVSSSKSQLMNSLINEKHNTFFHRNCPGSSRNRVLMDGVVEIAWFCPSGKNTDKFTDCVAFCNLHGDAGDHEKQLQILTEMASVNVVLLPQLDKNDRSAAMMNNLFGNKKPLICLLTEDQSTVMKMKKRKFKIGLKYRNQSDVSKELIKTINDCLSESSFTFRLEDVSQHSDIRVDEEDDDDCRRGRAAAQQIMNSLKKKHLTEIKESFMPHQGKLWHQWSQKNKELHRPRVEEKDIDISRKQSEMKKIREQQHESDISEFVKLFIKEMNTDAEHEKMFFIKWLRILLDEHISSDLSALLHKYDETWSAVLKLKDGSNKSEQHKAKQNELEKISEELQAATFGVEHIMREIGQIYESCSSVKKNKKDLKIHFSSLSSLAAEMMISGFPLELMDGDAAHVPLIWISAVLDQLIQKLGDQSVFVLSVLGIQSSGKSTMLNAMFGLQFAVSAGRTTRGAFMQLVRVSDEMKTQMNVDYILVVDTEGLGALELAGRSTRDHDNELATFVVGIGNLTLINIFGENPSEMQDILQIVAQAFIRMKKVRLNPSCVFVHQNVSDVTAGEKNMEGRRRLQETLDEMTKLISDELQAAIFGVEHIMREIGQIYESCSSVKKNKKDLQIHFSSLSSLAAEMMISGFPLELMDGDAAHVPLVWISSVLDQLIQKLGDQRVFVLSVLGIQSSGKSTMLNAMFGLQFAVSAGRCTRGAFMQLVRSDEMKTQMKIDYILVVDTEGLRALELSGRSTRDHDNELATFVVGIGNLTLINILGENPSEMQDILQIVVQAFMRMKKVNLTPSCVFVHQNVSDVTAGEKNKEGRRRLQETLEMTKLAAKDEVCDAECFSDVIRFDVQNDVKYFAQLWEGSPPMAPPNPNYCENIQELKESILSHAAKSHGIMLKDLTVRIEDLWEALLSERFVFSFRNSLEISAYRKLETEYSKWSWSLRSAMMETENKLHNKIENEVMHEVEEIYLQTELKKTSVEVEKSMSEFFEKDKDKDILIQWKTSFKIKIKDVHGNIVRDTKKKLNEVLQQRVLKKEIDAQRTHREDTLFEKSKELALKLKYKTNDKETLKKEFDSFWEQWIKKIITDTPPIKDIDIMRDVREILRDVYGSVSVDHWRESSEYNTIVTASYSEYVQVKKSSVFVKNVVRSAKEALGFDPLSLSNEDETQIKSFVRDVVQQTDREIQSFNISKVGYNKSLIQQLTGYIKARVVEHEEGRVKYVFKNEFFMDLVLSICERANKVITDQHRRFREANDPVVYVEKKREEYYSIFQKYCDGATSAAIFGEIICQKLKEPIEQSLYKKTARELANEMRTECASLKGNRSNLEKHILETLAEEEDFNKYMNYIHNPRDHFKNFITEEVSQYITDKFSVSVLPKMKENIELLQQKIMKAAHVQVKRGDAGLWLKSFTQQLSDELIFSEKDLSGVKHDDVDFRLLEDVMRNELPEIMSVSNFNTNTFNEKLDLKVRPDELLFSHFCQCCWVQCPFCGAFCTSIIENHPGYHSVPFHRVNGIKGWTYYQTDDLCADFCTTLVTSRKQFRFSDKWFPCNDYRSAGGVYAKWDITPDPHGLPYWKWFVCTFQKNLENRYNKKFKGDGEIPPEWRMNKKQDAIQSLKKLTVTN
uniref:VLIG-type G domain-containing protein n=1 Tax=Sinocyclocheilus anshuiensis TaxID=1608454 RepID=A0A671T6Z5_9TELE